MLKKMLISGVVALSLATGANAGEYDLKNNMNVLSSGLAEVQRGFLTNDKAFTQESLAKFKKEVHNLLSDKKNIEKMLPTDARFKSSIAVNSATIMKDKIDAINHILNDKNMRMIDRQKNSQRAFLELQNQCYRCHNLVRDWN